MIEQEMILLGLLRENPMHGYQIKKTIQEILSLFAGVDLKSIYYPLRVLEKKGLIVRKINKEGRRPQRFIYTLTPKGLGRFNNLLNKSLLDFKRPQFSLDLSLYFLRYIKPDIAKRRLRARLSILNKLSSTLKQLAEQLKKKKSSALCLIIEHNLQMVDTESRFLSQLIRTI